MNQLIERRPDLTDPVAEMSDPSLRGTIVAMAPAYGILATLTGLLIGLSALTAAY